MIKVKGNVTFETTIKDHTNSHKGFMCWMKSWRLESWSEWNDGKNGVTRFVCGNCYATKNIEFRPTKVEKND